ncbi:sensor histidine kinase [Plantactinospora sp. BB1]|uniref:sensor histidine kinase n=1 Tax=Plantactinospora sp. BB1 TaxID=2071627 RepID=UPI000D152593|nr:histidine kinase [Plantactinospora sp. BB1]AVT41403.1 two-component sensor histidine kinase [Plantactinospora sp. BB1]
MTIRAALAPLTSGATYRRGVFLLLGGVLLLPYLLLVTVFVEMLRTDEVPRAAVLLLVAVAAAIAAVPLFLRGTRALEIAAARTLLDVELSEPAADGGIDRETRLRCALWIAVHLVSGGLVGFALIAALPMALLFLFVQLGIGTEAIDGLQIGPLGDWHRGWLSLVGVGLLVLLGYAVAGLGALARLMAPVLLGPSQTERIAALERQASRLAERNRLARELHDSVGHALTVATLQAAAAGEVLETDREFVRRALRAIEETGRAAMTDLDHVLGLLREGDAERSGGAGPMEDDGPAGDGGRAPQRTLDELDRLVADTRATGLAVTVELAGDLGAVPAVVAREGYRIVQEGLTNAARHAGRRPVTLRVAARDDALEIELVNALDEPAGTARTRLGPGRPPGQRRGRGLAGIRERVVLLGGRVSAGPEDGDWRIAVWLPTTTDGRPGNGADMTSGTERT